MYQAHVVGSETRVDRSDKKGWHVEYLIEVVQQDGLKWMVSRRYSEFAELGLAEAGKLPSRLQMGELSRKQREQRTQALDAWLQGAQRVARGKIATFVEVDAPARVVYGTRSLCGKCVLEGQPLRWYAAMVMQRDHRIFLEGWCSQHGEFVTQVSQCAVWTARMRGEAEV